MSYSARKSMTNNSSKQSGNGHEWRDLTDEEVYAANHDISMAKRTPDGRLDREALQSWCKTRKCERCGIEAPDYLDPDQSSCNNMVVQGVHES